LTEKPFYLLITPDKVHAEGRIPLASKLDVFIEVAEVDTNGKFIGMRTFKTPDIILTRIELRERI
jgi:hypothetical protein